MNNTQISDNSDTNPTADDKAPTSLELSFAERIGKWNVTRVNLNWIFGLSGAALIVLFILSCLKIGDNWISSLVGIVGGLASIFGIYLTLCQLVETKKNIAYVKGVAEATKQATEETRRSLQKTMNVAQVAKFCEQIKRIQEHFDKKELNVVVLLIHELQEAVIELQNYLKSIKVDFNDKDLSVHVKKMGMNSTFLRMAIERNNEKYNREDMRKDFQNLLNVMLELKAQLTTHENERSQNPV